MAGTAMWTSKLGNKYPKSWIQEHDGAMQAELRRLRGLKANGNDLCADCGRRDSSWASVTHGVFVCVTCSDVHRSVGTHVTKMKDCTGNFHWGPDEIERMQVVGNHKADEIYGAKKVDPNASKEEKQRFVLEKYQKRPIADAAPAELRAAEVALGPPAAAAGASARPTLASQRPRLLPAPVCARQHSAQPVPAARQPVISDSFFEELFGEPSKPAEPMLQPEPRTPVAPEAKSSDLDLESFFRLALSESLGSEPAKVASAGA